MRTCGGSLIIPTYNEVENIQDLIPKVFENDLNLEVILVDDNSPDGTYSKAEKLSQHFPVKAINRTEQKGLSSAVIEGIKHAKYDIIGVMDADFQHPPSFIPRLYQEIQDADIALASRYVHEGGTNKFSMFRKLASNGASVLAKPLTSVKDPMSGFFFFRRDVIKEVKLDPVGYKILLEILVKGNYGKVKEIPFVLQERYKGKTKLNIKVLSEYLVHLIKLSIFKIRRRISHKLDKSRGLPHHQF